MPRGGPEAGGHVGEAEDGGGDEELHEHRHKEQGGEVDEGDHVDKELGGNKEDPCDELEEGGEGEGLAEALLGAGVVAPEGRKDGEDRGHHRDDDDILEGDAEVLEEVSLDERLESEQHNALDDELAVRLDHHLNDLDVEGIVQLRPCSGLIKHLRNTLFL